MEIPILLGASPKTANPVEWIPIRFDRWQVRVEGLIDSKLTLHSNKPTVEEVTLSSINGAIYQGPCRVRVEFNERGTEKAISVFAKEHK
ncbi:hypothetical protein LCGC14_0908860 [marine sediment metagenome]|uniref:Uncharacterized protein n=1 Tax=marine sediment metagenome TaxID=412755 RepID=A0A0F9S103_9ZZZZ